MVGLLITIYVIMAFCGIFLHYNDKSEYVYPLNVFSIAYLTVSIIIVILPFTGLRGIRLSTIDLENSRFIKNLETLFILFSFGAIGFFFPFAFEGIISGEIALRRENMIEISEKLKNYGIINTFFSQISSAFVVPVIFAFINLIRYNRLTKRFYLLIASSTSYVVYILAYLGRDGVVYWILTTFAIYLFFRPYIKKKLTNKIKNQGIVFIALITIPFFFITIQRFGKSQMGNGVLWSILDYVGQQIRNFNDQWHADVPLTYGATAFPQFAEWLGFLGFNINLNSDQKLYFLDWGLDSNVFSTFIGSWLKNFGKIGTLLIVIFLNILSSVVVKNAIKSSSLSISKFLVLILIYQNALWGVFYFRFSSVNFYIIVMLLLNFIIRLNRNRSTNNIIHLNSYN